MLFSQIMKYLQNTLVRIGFLALTKIKKSLALAEIIS